MARWGRLQEEAAPQEAPVEGHWVTSCPAPWLRRFPTKRLEARFGFPDRTGGLLLVCSRTGQVRIGHRLLRTADDGIPLLAIACPKCGDEMVLYRAYLDTGRRFGIGISSRLDGPLRAR